MSFILILVTQKNKQIARYRIMGMTIIFLALFGLSFSILLFQEMSQRQAIMFAQSGN